ncbi:glycoside hydrolase family 97 protein [Pseudoduganella chitinolytica]|uniref:Glycoside hydrolase family 97 catalytic domain-containing protein n=1 Tax=Pseudoduganella chitinolytica TaxID=34070 RepID=A0ABY8BF42_9BURK|nr:glycoside hydrolase family 97 protein [Pseudoduganella chitinolytica]WEF33918.1 glycoside hydrolase family 97 catalytic domain-containing protein [Pseudoduganella chitinolytica]
MTLTRLIGVAACAAAPFACAQPATSVTSPDGKLAVTVATAANGTVTYRVSRAGKPVLLPSALGLTFEDADLASGLKPAGAGATRRVADRYELATGKRRHVSYAANERTWRYTNPRQQALAVTFRVSNDGVAFRYHATGEQLALRSEATTFALPPLARAWLQPMSVAKTGYQRTNPSYEEHYRMDIPVGTPAPLGAGWVFPALFRTGDTWVAVTEAGMDGSFHASRLQTGSTGGVYRIGAPAPEETFTGGALLPAAQGSMTTPWRVLAIGPLATVVESTLGTDLAAPAPGPIPAWVKPGHASWSWAILKDDYTNFDTQKQFIDYAAGMGWDYTLVDAYWDKKIGYDRLAELAAYANGKGIGLLAWYNSAGAWNDTDMTPRDRMLTHEIRVAEFARLRAMGVKGIKVDFFGGDGQSMIRYYTEILKDAYDAQLLVNFHGATLPRGWSRTWPNLLTAEAVRGFEFTTFTQEDQDAVAPHAAMLPFTRNLFDPMDFTPISFGDIPKIRRTTRNGFELAEAVLFTSGIQHFAEIPQGMASAPDYVQALLRDLPRSWDDSRFVAGEPGKYVVIARKAGDAWYVAGINAQDSAQALVLDLSFAKGAGRIVTDGAGEREFSQADLRAAKRTAIGIAPKGGFVAIFR